MNNICGATMLIGLCFPATLQDPLTRAAVEAAASDLKGVEMALFHHSGEKSDGSSTVIKGDGAVVQTWSESYPLAAAEKSSTRKLRIALTREEVETILRLFANDEVLALPKTHPELVGPKDGWPKTMRYSLKLSIGGVGSFEGEHPDLDGSKLPQSKPARLLIQAIRTAVKELADRISKQDREFLTKQRLPLLTDGFSLELRDIQGLWGGDSVRLRSDGRVEGVSVRPPRQGERGMQTRHFTGTVDPGRAAAILKNGAERGTFDVQPKRRNGIPDEARPTLVVEATVDGVTYSRAVAMWAGEASEQPAFQQMRQALQEIVAELLKREGK